MSANIKFRNNYTEELFDKIDDLVLAWTDHNEQKARAITDECMLLVTPYEAFLIGLAFSTGSNLIATDFFYKSSAVCQKTFGWTVFLVDKSRNADASYPMHRILPLAEIWLQHAAENGEVCAMAYLAYLHEYNLLDYSASRNLELARSWMHRALTASDFRDFYLKEEERLQDKTASADILPLLKEYLPLLQGSFSVYPNIDQKKCDFIMNIFERSSTFSEMEPGKLLNQKKVLGTFSSKVNWSMPALLMIFTDKYVISNLFHEEIYPGSAPKLAPYMEYDKIDTVDTVPFTVNGGLYEAVRFRFKGGSPSAGYLAYNPKRLDGHSLRTLFEKIALPKEDYDFNLRVVSMLRSENKYGADYDPLLTNENISAFDGE